MHVAVAIVGYRNPSEVVACLHALRQSTYDDFEIVVCENGGRASYDTLMLALETPILTQPVKVVQARGNIGYAGGVNLCIDNAPAADAFWILNPDTVARPGALEAMVAAMRRHGYGMVGGRLIDETGMVQSDGGLFRAWMARSVSLNKGMPAAFTVDPSRIAAQLSYVSGASLLVDRRALEVAGPMREDYFLYCEEVEWCLRAKARGVRLGYAADAVIEHSQGGTTGSGHAVTTRPRLPIYLDERNKLNTVRDTAPLKLPVATIVSLLLLLARYGRHGAWPQLRFALQGWGAGVLDRRGPPPWLEA